MNELLDSGGNYNPGLSAATPTTSGALGAVPLHGTGAPAVGDLADGQIYIDDATGELYWRAGGVLYPAQS